MKRLLTWMLLLLVLTWAMPALAADEPRFRVFWNLTGGTVGALDNYRSDGVGTRTLQPLKTGDISLVIRTGHWPKSYTYDDTSTATADMYIVVIPKDYPASGRWIQNRPADGTYKLGEDFSALSSACSVLNSLGTDATLEIDQNVVLSSTLSFNSTVWLSFKPGMRITTTGTGFTLAIYSPDNVIAKPNQQCFIGAVSFTVPGIVFPDWWLKNTIPGTTDMTSAVTYAVSSGAGDIRMSYGIYALQEVVVSGPGKIKIEGMGRGTIVQPVTSGVYEHFTFAFVNCNNVEIGQFSYDGRGSDVLETYPLPIYGSNLDDINIYDIYAFDGGDIEDRGCISLWGVDNVTVDNVTAYDFDCGVIVASGFHDVDIGRCRFIGGKSEGISIYTSASAPEHSTNSRFINVHHNYIQDKTAYSIQIGPCTDAAISINNNIMANLSRPQSQSGGILVVNSSGINLENNFYFGNSIAYGFWGQCRNISMSNNSSMYAAYAIAFVAGDNDTEVDGFVCTGGIHSGLKNAPTYDAGHTYWPGEPCVSGGIYYMAVAETTGNIPPNATYWKVVNQNAAIFGSGNLPVLKNAVFDGVNVNNWTNSVFSLQSASIDTTTFTNCKFVDNYGRFNLNVPNTETIDSLKLIANVFDCDDANAPAMALTSYKIKNSIIRDNLFDGNGAYWATVNLNSIIVENSSFENNTIVNSGTASYYEQYGTFRKKDNYLDSAWFDTDTPRNGYVKVGDTYWKTDPAASGTLAYVCTTAGYAYKEAYNTGHSYVVGEHVLGSDSKVYVCILADSGSADHAPITGASYATYWQLANGVGTPVCGMSALTLS